MSSVVALMLSECWDLPSLPQDSVLPVLVTLGQVCCYSVNSPAQCGEIISVSMRGIKFRCRHSSLSPMKSPLPSPTPAPRLRLRPWDIAKDHPGMNSNCSSNLILAAPSECLFYCTSQLGPWTSTPGVTLAFFICWIKISAAVTSCT